MMSILDENVEAMCSIPAMHPHVVARLIPVIVSFFRLDQNDVWQPLFLFVMRWPSLLTGSVDGSHGYNLLFISIVIDQSCP